MVATLPPGAVTHVTVVGADGYTVYNSLTRDSASTWVIGAFPGAAVRRRPAGDRHAGPVAPGNNWTFA